MGKFDIDRPIAELFSVEPYALRIRNVCNSHDIATIRELCLHSNWDLLHFRHLGERSIAHMEEMLGNFGLRLGMTEEDLDAYMRFETEDDKDVTTIMRFEESEEVKWDQRRYEVARDLYVRCWISWRAITVRILWIFLLQGWQRWPVRQQSRVITAYLWRKQRS